MLIKSYKTENKFDGDWNIVEQTHTQRIDHILHTNKEIKNKLDGFTADRSMRLKCRIPLVLFNKVGHIIAPNGVIDEKALDRWLDSPEGEKCKVVKGSAKNV